MTPELNVLIVGCGNIAGVFDMNQPSSELPCTHAGAYHQDERFKIVACVDPNPRALQAFMNYWDIEFGFKCVKEAIEADLPIDIVSICSPTDNHKQDALQVLSLKPKLIFCEKPVTPNCKDTLDVVEACRSANTLLCVNHNRRWDPKILEVKQKLEASDQSAIRAVVGQYNKGILNNGSHLIDILQYLLGRLTLVASGKPTFDYSPKDPSVPAIIETESGIQVHLVTGHAEDYALFEIQFVFTDGLLTMRSGGSDWSWRPAAESERFKGYKHLVTESVEPGGYKFTSQGAVNNIYEAINSDAPLASCGRTAYEAQYICEQIANSVDY